MMNPDLIRLNDYLTGFSIDNDGTPLKAIMTTAQADATSKLSFLSGIQVLAARPDERRTYNGDSYSRSLNTAFFVVAKGLAQSGDYEMENEQYRLLARLAAAIVDRVMSDSTSGVCNLLAGLAVASVDIAPESSIFGGWCGYSVEISFE
ncbi:MAG: hypothetical protein ACI3ZM_02040 [Candidatus Cryptobacteroides sp.]